MLCSSPTAAAHSHAAAVATAALVLSVLWLLLTLRPPLRTAGASRCTCSWVRPYMADLFWDVLLSIYWVVSASVEPNLMLACDVGACRTSNPRQGCSKHPPDHLVALCQHVGGTQCM
jgi:hypothetical protein